MNIQELQQRIMQLKKEKDICILAHSYQAKEIIEVADFTGVQKLPKEFLPMVLTYILADFRKKSYVIS